MKTAYFTLANPEYESKIEEAGFEKSWGSYRIPILPAYAIASYTIQGMKFTLDGDVSSIKSSIFGDIVRVDGISPLTHMISPPEATLIINYLGIRDYTCFFPHFKNEQLKCRAAEFMEEADKAFEEASWLSFVLMAGGVFESFLVDITGDTTSAFGKLIGKVEDLDIFSVQEIGVLREASEARNLVHAGKFDQQYIAREKAMSIRLALEQLLRKDWFSDRSVWSSGNSE